MGTQEELVNKAFNRLSLEKKDLASDADKIILTSTPIITIARDPGSGGRPIAAKIADKLGFKLYDEELILEIASSAKESKRIVKSLDETQKSIIETVLSELFQPDHLSQDEFVKHLIRVVLSLASIGKAVILGRGSNLIAPKHDALNVYITAPLKTRISRAIRYEKIDAKEARERITRITRERKEFVSNHFGKSYTHSNNYDLILNTEFFSINGSAEIILKAFKKKFR